MVHNSVNVRKIIFLLLGFLCFVSNNLYAITADEFQDSYKAFYVDVDGDGLKDL
jgi:hypothetical protein